MPIRRNRIVNSFVLTTAVLGLLTTIGIADQGQSTEEKNVANASDVELPQIEQPKASTSTQKGIASWYGGSFIGRKTASGERYRPEERTAAHRTLAFGTYVRVTNLRNKKSAVVRINNRGPFTKGRIIDLSRQAATDLGMVKSGIARVSVEVLTKEVAMIELGISGINPM